jgi:hypothetical protein
MVISYLTSTVDEQGLKAEREKTDLRVRATRDVKLKEAVMASGNDPASLNETGTVTVCCQADNDNQYMYGWYDVTATVSHRLLYQLLYR